VSLELRAATAADEPFLREMLWAAANWRDETVDAPLGAQFAHYVEGFGRRGDAGVVAELDGRPVGAAWARFVHGYGFVADDVPELSIGVRPEARGRGIGAALVDALAAALGRAGVARLSLSVEPDNPARRIYERAGFVHVGTDPGGSWTMVREI
jgi:ribosomal protein S18 acetylase RimI-like enzyme